MKLPGSFYPLRGATQSSGVQAGECHHKGGEHRQPTEAHAEVYRHPQAPDE